MKEAFSLRKKIGRDKLAHTETIVKPETPVLDRMLRQDELKGVLRLFVGATETMPTRALSYVLAAARLGELLPIKQVQVIGVLAVAQRVNGTDIEASREQFNLLAQYSTHMFERTAPAMLDNTIFATDGNPEIADKYAGAVEEVLRTDDKLARIFKTKGLKHGGDPIPYLASHIAYQETDELQVVPILDGSLPIEPDVVVSAGSQQEKPFHDIRCRIRDLDVDNLVPSLQVFTKHISAPYFMARGGEQALHEAASTRNIEFEPPDRHAALDMSHLQLFIGGAHE